MKIKEILAKVVEGSELSDEEKTFLADYEEQNLDAAVNARGKKERLKNEAKIAALQEQIAERDAEIEDASSSATEVEKLQKQFEKLNSKFEASQTALVAEQSAHANTQRSNALKSVDVPWLPSVPQNYRDSVMSGAFDGIDTEDIADANVVAPIIKGIMDSQANFITASTSGGAGTSVNEGASVSSGDKITIDNVGQLTGQALLDNLDEAFAVANQASE